MAGPALAAGVVSPSVFVAGYFLPGAVGGACLLLSAVSGVLAVEWGRRERRSDRRARIGWICGTVVMGMFALALLVILIVVVTGGSVSHRS